MPVETIFLHDTITVTVNYTASKFSMMARAKLDGKPAVLVLHLLNKNKFHGDY